MNTELQPQLDTINRRFCSINFKGQPLLCIPNGYFAGDAFSREDDISSVSGSSFGFIAGDGNYRYKQSKHSISEVTDDEILKLLEQERISPEFRTRVKDTYAKKNPIRPTKHWK